MTNLELCGNHPFMIVSKITLSESKRRLPFQPNEGFTAIRLEHWHNSRSSLSDCLESFTGAPAATLEELKISSHHHLQKYPQYLVSISHTRGAAAAVLLQESDGYLGVGIDIEEKDRVIKPHAMEKFAVEEDHFQSPLKLWCAKEAAFKASSYYWKQEKTFVLKDIILKGTTFKIDGLGEGKITFEEKEGYLVSVAILTKLSL